MVFRFAWRAAASHRTVGWHRTAPQAGGIAAEGGSRGGGVRRTRCAWWTEMTHPALDRGVAACGEREERRRGGVEVGGGREEGTRVGGRRFQYGKRGSGEIPARPSPCVGKERG